MQSCQEIWKDIEGFKNKQVSSLARVRSLGKKGERIISQHKTTYGYYAVSLRDGYKKTTMLVHRLVAKAFIPYKSGRPDINHINGIKTDNSISNLEWCTKKENVLHAVRLGLRKKKTGPQGILNGRCKLSETDVIQIHQLRGNGVPVTELTKMFNVCPTSIKNIVRHKSWKHLSRKATS